MGMNEILSNKKHNKMKKGKEYTIEIVDPEFLPCDPFKVKVLDIDKNNDVLVLVDNPLHKDYQIVINSLNFETINSDSFYDKNKKFMDDFDEDIVIYHLVNEVYETCLGFKIKFNKS